MSRLIQLQIIDKKTKESERLNMDNKSLSIERTVEIAGQFEGHVEDRPCAHCEIMSNNIILTVDNDFEFKIVSIKE